MKNIFREKKDIVNTIIKLLGFGITVHFIKNYFYIEVVNTVNIFMELKNYFFIASGLLITYLIINYKKQINWKNIISLILFFIYTASIFIYPTLISIIFVLMCTLTMNLKNHIEDNVEPLISKRQDDLSRIVKYLNKFESIGINAKWGDGKSFILEKLKNHKEVKEKYEFIEIDILSCNIDELQNIIINELENVLYKNGIISNYSHRLKEILKISSLRGPVRKMRIYNAKEFS